MKFPGISSEEFIHPLDKESLDAVKNVLGLEIVTKKAFELGIERIFYLENIASNLQVTSSQCPKIYKMLKQSCEILDIPEPELYIEMDPVPNAFTSGVNKPFIVITSGMIELMKDDELLAIIGHELGHIKCQHIKYSFLVWFLTKFLEDKLSQIPGKEFAKLVTLPATLPLIPLKLALFRWSRNSEFSADRAGLLVTQNLDICINVQMKFAGGSKKLEGQLNKEEFIKQINTFAEAEKKDFLNKIYKFGLVIWRTHPWAILRAKELMEWANSRAYKNIIAGNYRKPLGKETTIKLRFDK